MIYKPVFANGAMKLFQYPRYERYRSAAVSCWE